jgi:hypothetical protein
LGNWRKPLKDKDVFKQQMIVSTDQSLSTLKNKVRCPQSMGGELMRMFRVHLMASSNLKIWTLPNTEWISMILQARMNLWAVRQVILLRQMFRIQL